MTYQLCGNDFWGEFVVGSYAEALSCLYRPGVWLILSTGDASGKPLLASSVGFGTGLDLSLDKYSGKGKWASKPCCKGR